MDKTFCFRMLYDWIKAPKNFWYKFVNMKDTTVTKGPHHAGNKHRSPGMLMTIAGRLAGDGRDGSSRNWRSRRDVGSWTTGRHNRKRKRVLARFEGRI